LAGHVRVTLDQEGRLTVAALVQCRQQAQEKSRLTSHESLSCVPATGADEGTGRGSKRRGDFFRCVSFEAGARSRTLGARRLCDARVNSPAVVAAVTWALPQRYFCLRGRENTRLRPASAQARVIGARLFRF